MAASLAVPEAPFQLTTPRGSTGHNRAPTPLAALAQRSATDVVLYWPDGTLTAEEMRGRIAAIAASEPSGAAPHGPVAVVAANRVDLLVGVMAGLALGRPVMPLDPARPDLEACLVAAGPCAVLRTKAPAAAWEWVPAQASRKSSPPDARGAELWVPTSGTTGPARIARLPAAALDAQASSSALSLPHLGPGDRWLVCLPAHTIGALAALWRTLSAAASLAILLDFDACAARRLMAAGASHVSVVPAMLAPLADLDAPPPQHLRCLLTGGGPLSRTAAEVALAQGWPLWQGWGMTETASHVAAGRVERDAPPGVIGHPLVGAKLAIDPATGRIRIAGAMVMSGYARADGAPGAGLSRDGSFLSGDLGEWLADGRLRVLGRADEIIVSGGVNIHPQVVEEALACCPGVSEVGVTGRPDPRWGAVVVAVYSGTVSPRALEEWARSHIPSAQRPRLFLPVARLPRNAMGKLSRRELAQLGIEAQAGSVG